MFDEVAGRTIEALCGIVAVKEVVGVVTYRQVAVASLGVGHALVVVS